MQKDAKIYVAGHRGMVGSAVVRALRDKGYNNILTRTRKELDLTSQAAVREFYQNEKPDIADLAHLVKKVTGYQGELTFDTSKPDGTPRKLTDISKIKETGWAPKIPIEEGVALAYQSFLQEKAEGSLRE